MIPHSSPSVAAPCSVKSPFQEGGSFQCIASLIPPVQCTDKVQFARKVPNLPIKPAKLRDLLTKPVIITTMTQELDDQAKLALYRLVINRYKGIINEKETRSVSELRQLVSPYNQFIEKLRDSMLTDIIPYTYKNHFFIVAERAISYIREIRTCQFAFNFWMTFDELSSMKMGTAMDKAILLAALLRAFQSGDARVLVSRKGKVYVRFSWQGDNYLVSSESGSMLSGEDVLSSFSDDPVAYSFNDLVYENYEEG